jgi:hypothetical protein
MKITAAGTGSLTSSKGVVLQTSGVHAREYAPPELLMRFAESLVKNYNVDADTSWILEHTEIHIIVLYVGNSAKQSKRSERTSDARTAGNLWRCREGKR